MNKNPRVFVTMEPGLLRQVEAYAKDQGFSSNSKAAAELVRKGIISLTLNSPPYAKENGLDGQEREFIRLLRQSDDAHRRLAVQVLQLSDRTNASL